VPGRTQAGGCFDSLGGAQAALRQHEPMPSKRLAGDFGALPAVLWRAPPLSAHSGAKAPGKTIAGHGRLAV